MKKIISAVALAAIIVSSPSVLAASSEHDSAQHSNKIVDVTNGKEIRGVSTPENAWGYGNISFEDGEFSSHAAFEGLSDPVGDDFYEGWLVQQSPFKFISTGEAIKKDDGKYHNSFTSDIDYESYDFYVLTLEPNDGDPAPADHILEGNITVGKEMMKDHNNEWKDVTIDLTGENFAFSRDTIEVYKGDKVTINFESTGGFHDWGVDEFDAWTKQVNPGETTSVTFVADKVGSFEFYCSVGNHRAQGMLGWLIVKEREDKTKEHKTSLSAQAQALRGWIYAKLSKLNSSSFDPQRVLDNLDGVRASLASRNLSEKKLELYQDVLDAVEDVLHEIIANN